MWKTSMGTPDASGVGLLDTFRSVRSDWGGRRIPVPDSGTDAGRSLTPREREVLEQAALGLSNRQIGEVLQIAEQTVKNHLSSAMRKLSLHDRTHAVVIAIGQGLISLPVREREAADLVEGHRLVPTKPLTD
jgi:DNA-binding CsgD family transcriptional regulator